MKFDEVAQLQWTQVNFEAHIIRVKGKGNERYAHDWGVGKVSCRSHSTRLFAMHLLAADTDIRKI
jgi:hypothetical protein